MIVRKLDVQLPMQSMHITTEVVSLNPTHCEIYSIQHYVIKFVSDLRQVNGFHQKSNPLMLKLYLYLLPLYCLLILSGELSPPLTHIGHPFASVVNCRHIVGVGSQTEIISFKINDNYVYISTI